MRMKLTKLLAYLLAVSPIIYAIYHFLGGKPSVNPIEDMIRTTGFGAISMLVLSLSFSSLNRVFKKAELVIARRILGLAAIYLGILHLFIFVAIDYGFDPKFLLEAIGKKPYVYVGFTALLLMVPRAVTSYGKLKKYYGKHKKVIDFTVYGAAVAAALHYYWLVKSDITYPVIFISLFSILFLIRIAYYLKDCYTGSK